MMSKSVLIPKVNVYVDVWDVRGARPKHLRREKVGNLAVLAGRNLIRDFLHGDAVTGLERFALGTDATAPAGGNTQLGAEVFRDQFTQVAKADGKLTIKYYLSSTSANGNTLAEAGLFGNGATDVANTGTLYARVTFSPIEKTSALAVTFTWELTWEVS